MTIERLTILVCAFGLLAACTEEPPPPTIAEFMENPVLLDATIVQCGRHRSETRYDPECVNARDAADRLAVAAEEARREELKAQSERKQEAVRRAQEAVAEASRRAREAEQQQQTAAYLNQFGVVPADAGASPETTATPASETETPAAPAEQPTETVSDLEAVREELQQRQQH